MRIVRCSIGAAGWWPSGGMSTTIWGQQGRIPWRCFDVELLHARLGGAVRQPELHHAKVVGPRMLQASAVSSPALVSPDPLHNPLAVVIRLSCSPLRRFW